MILDWVIKIVTLVFALGGLFFMLVAAIGTLHLSDLYSRMHAATKASTLGITGLAIAAALFLGDWTAASRLVLIILFFFITAPIGAYALAEAVFSTNLDTDASLKLDERTKRYDLHEARILCPVRGGPDSQYLYTKAIQLAKKNRGELTFLHVINRDLIEAMSGPAEAIGVLEQLKTLGESVIAAAQNQAQTEGVVAKGQVVTGDLKTEIIHTAKEINATIILLGYPMISKAADREAAEKRLWMLVEQLEKALEVQVQVQRVEVTIP
ncbi:MAG: monovalent cation/H(+) antiporter subunit G [Anaerolineae bacterium]|nr:monovalent cation/H(+) antiporter subunit G [Anaerolineae bacterium]